MLCMGCVYFCEGIFFVNFCIFLLFFEVNMGFIFDKFFVIVVIMMLYFFSFIFMYCKLVLILFRVLLVSK